MGLYFLAVLNNEHHKFKYVDVAELNVCIMGLIEVNCRSHKATGARGQVATATSR